MATRRSDEYWDKRAIARSTEIDAHLNAQTPKLARIYNDANRRIQSDIDTIYRNYATKTGVDVPALKKLLSKAETDKTFKSLNGVESQQYILDNYKARITRLEQMKLQLHANVKRIYGDEVKLATKTHATTLKKSYLRTAYDIEKGTNVGGSFSTINNRRLDQMLRGQWSGGNYSSRIWNNTDALATDISERIPAGLLAGQSPARLSREIRERFNVHKYEADRLVRTETTYFEGQSELALYDELGVDKYVFVATLDTRTSIICGSLDGKIFDVAKAEVGVNYAPMHPNCRSKARAYLGAEFEPTKRRARIADQNDPDKPHSEIIDYTTYDNWIKTVPAAKATMRALPTIPAAGVNPTAQASKQMLTDSQGEIMDMEAAAAGTNPNYGSHGSYSVNCQRTVPTYELRRRGFDLEALPNVKNSRTQIISGTNRDILRIFNADEFDFRQYTLLKSETTGNLYRKLLPKSAVAKALKEFPEGARLQLSYQYTRRRVGHTIAVERVPVSDKYPHGLAFVDPQVNKIAGGLDLKGKSKFTILRTDNREINLDVLGDVAKRRNS